MSAAVVETLRRALGEGKVRTDEAARAERRHDSWVLSALADVQGRQGPLPCCVVRPASVEDVVAVVNACRATRAPLVPFGLGSGVCGGVLASAEAVVLDMGAMAKVRGIDARNLLASFDAGVRGTDAEAAVLAQGLTLGHYPQSIGVSSVGGWVATRAAGQFSTGYGNMEEALFALEVVLPSGEVLRTRETPRASAGPDLRQVFLGSEGLFGVVTGVTFSLRRKPEHRVPLAFHVPSMDAGFELQREIVQRGHAPVVLRQYDSQESSRMFSAYSRPDAALLLVVSEGPRSRVLAEVQEIGALGARMGASDADPAATERWFHDRNHVPTLRSFIENGIVVDTIEIAATWSRIGKIYADAIAALGGVQGILAASAHSSHVYRSGINLYFTFAARPEAGQMEATYLECWRRVMQATADGGGGVAHHHGIGRVRRDWLGSEVGPAGLATLHRVKAALDPEGIFNPGVLLPSSEKKA